MTQEDLCLLSVIADIRKELGVGDKPMLTELAGEVKKLKAKHNCAMDTLQRIAGRSRKTQERNLAKSCVVFLESMDKA